MATNIRKKNLSVDLRNTVQSAITAVRAVRRSETARKQSEFQKAISDGLSYEDQLKFLQKQKEEEGSIGTLGDSEFIAALDKDIASTKQLVRFAKFRSKYQDSLASLNSGKTTADQQLAMLKDQFENTNDPELKAEIQKDITSTQTELKRYNDTIISNQIARAQKDGSSALINTVMDTVRSKRASAAIDGNEEEVSYYDLQLTALTSQLAQTRIQDTLNDATVRALTSGMKATQKLDLLKQQIESSDGSAPITVSGTRYNSAKEYWQTLQGAYLGGSGSGVFNDFFRELGGQTKDFIDTASRRDGYATEPTLASVNSTYTNLSQRPEMALYQDNLTTTKTSSLYDAVSTTANRILNSATSGNFTMADNALQNLGRTYGIDVTAYRTDLAAVIAQQKAGGLGTPEDTTAAERIIKEASVIPTISDPSKPATPATPATPAAPVVEPVSKDYKVVAGDTLSKIALANRVTVSQLLDLNPQYKANPNLIQVNDSIKLAPTAAVTPVQTPATPAVVTPAPTPVPTTTTPGITPTTARVLTSAQSDEYYATEGQKSMPLSPTDWLKQKGY